MNFAHLPVVVEAFEARSAGTCFEVASLASIVSAKRQRGTNLRWYINSPSLTPFEVAHFASIVTRSVSEGTSCDGTPTPPR